MKIETLIIELNDHLVDANFGEFESETFTTNIVKGGGDFVGYEKAKDKFSKEFGDPFDESDIASETVNMEAWAAWFRLRIAAKQLSKVELEEYRKSFKQLPLTQE